MITHSGAANGVVFIVPLADGRVAHIKELRHPGLVQRFRFAVVEPQTVARLAAISDDLANRNLFHLIAALGTQHDPILRISTAAQGRPIVQS